MLKLLKRCTTTAIKLPFAMAWDVLSLGNMGDGASTTRVLREHEFQKQLDDVEELVERAARIKRSVDQ